MKNVDGGTTSHASRRRYGVDGMAESVAFDFPPRGSALSIDLLDRFFGGHSTLRPHRASPMKMITVVSRPLHSSSLAVVLVRQLDAIRVLPLPFVFLGKNLFEPSRLSLRRVLVHRCRVMKDDKLLAAAVTPQRAHLLERWCLLSRLTLLDRHCFHPLPFYSAVRIAL